jgi:hypothetical protein
MRTVDNHFPTTQYVPQPPANPAWMNAPVAAQVPTAAPRGEGRGLMIAGYILVGLTLLIPLLALPGLVVGIITASVKKTQRIHGVAIIVGSLVVGALAFVVWASINT